MRELLSGGLVVDGDVVGDGDGHERPLQPNDVAVITPHVEQAGAVAARLADLPGVLIGTANQAQGLEREAVVDDRTVLRDALTRSMGESTVGDIKAEFERRLDSGEFVALS